MTWFSRLRNWQTDASNGIGIRADYHDSEDDNFATGINASLNIAGLNSPTANIPWGAFKITGLANGTAATDAAAFGQIQTSVANYAVDSSGTDAYAINPTPALTAYVAGLVFRFYPATINTGAATLNISSLGAKTIKKDKDVDLADGDIKVGQIQEVVYDGTNFQLQSCPYGILTQNGASIYGADAGASDTYVITLPTVPSAYTTGMVVRFKANTKNTGACSLNANSLGAKSIKKDNVDPADNDIAANQIVEVIYDGTNFQMLSPVAGAVGQNGQSIYALDTGSANAYAIALSPVPVAYATGMVVRFKSSFQNSASATLNVNSLGAITLKKSGSTNLASADIASGQFVEAAYDGTNFQVISPITNGVGTVTSVATGDGLSGGTITTSGTVTVATGVAVNTASASTKVNFSTSSTSYVDITNLTVSITPKHNTSTILVAFNLCYSSSAASNTGMFQIVRGSTAIGIGTAAGSGTPCTSAFSAASTNTNIAYSVGGSFLDSPATTSSTSYKIQMLVTSGTGYINTAQNNTGASADPLGISTITVTEIY